ncbi:MAG: hypothetical protein HPY69_06555 [Armatimonadetes bacterium]|nr:hypothetical protein [Armatimonadota bacterium]
MARMLLLSTAICLVGYAQAQVEGVTERRFLMGFTSWPYAATLEAVQGTYNFIGAHGDLLTEHFDNGVPWPEMVRDEPFPAWLQAKLEGLKASRPVNCKVALSLTPLNMGRNGLAPCAGEGERPPLPTVLEGKPFDDPVLIRAYTNYCLRMIELFRPDYCLTGIEANELLSNKPEQWPAYVRLSRAVQAVLRARYPELPLAESITLHKLYDPLSPKLAEYQAQVKEFIAPHDYLAISFYPLLPGITREAQYTAALDFLPTFTDKPIAFAETGCPAERLTVAAYGLDLPFTPADQDVYVRALLTRAQREGYLYVTYWAHRDFDALWDIFPDNVKDLGRLWRDTGLLDEAGNERPACETWRAWFRVAHAAP